MVDVDKSVIARLKKDGKVFEILVDCDNALRFKKGESIGLNEVVATDDIFSDVKKGERPSVNVLKKIFGTDDNLEIAKKIINDGEIQLTTKHQAKIREEKRKRIINLIHTYTVDAKTGLPHPPQRIENAMEEAKVKIDDYKNAEDQMEDIITKIRVIIPVKMETREIQIRIPVQYAAKSFPILKKYKLLKDEWKNDGSLVAIVQIPAGLQDELMGQLNSLCHGNVEINILGGK